MNLGPLACEAIASPRRVVLDMDSTEVRVHGRQEQSAYNGHFESTCYHPLLLFNRDGDCVAAKLRPGNVHSADGWEELLLREIERGVGCRACNRLVGSSRPLGAQHQTFLFALSRRFCDFSTKDMNPTRTAPNSRNRAPRAGPAQSRRSPC